MTHPAVLKFLHTFNLDREDLCEPRKSRTAPLVESSFITHLVAYQLECEPEDMWRVEMLGHGYYKITDMTLPPLKKQQEQIVFKQDVPQFILDAIAVLSVCEINQTIPEIGKRMDRDIFYILERKS